MPKHDYYIFHDESRSPGKGPSFLSALLITKVEDANRIHKAVQSVRNELGFDNEIKFAKVSSARYEAYCAVLDELAKLHWTFCAILVSKNFLQLNRFGNSKRVAEARAYNFFTKLLAQWRMQHYPGRTLFISDKRNRLHVDNFESYLPWQLNEWAMMRGLPTEVTRVLTLDSKRVTQLQIVDLLTGIVRVVHEDAKVDSEWKKKIVRFAMEHPGLRGRLGDVWRWRPYDE